MLKWLKHYVNQAMQFYTIKQTISFGMNEYRYSTSVLSSSHTKLLMFTKHGFLQLSGNPDYN